MTRAWLRTVALALLAVAACTKANLERWPPERGLTRDDKLEISGHLCTRSPESLVFPLRVLFVVDCSDSMKVTDPPDPVTGITGRERAVRQVWTKLLAEGSKGVRIGIIRFSAQAQSRTPVDLNGDGVADTYFTADPNQLDAATKALHQTDRTTNYINALSETFFELRTEMLRQNLSSLPLSKYVVIFLSDGLPDTDTTQGNLNTTDNILSSVKQLKDLAKLFHVGSFSFHTAYLASDVGGVADVPAQTLLQKMAAVGGGTYRSFPSGESLNFLHVDLSVLRRVFTLKSLAVWNVNALQDMRQVPLDRIPRIDDNAWVDLNQNGKMDCGEPLVDTDGDGLADVVEERIGTDPFTKDTDDDGLSDRIEWDFRKSGLDPLDPKDSGCFVPDVCVNRKPDGSCDCLLDTNHDGICNCVTDPTHPCVDNAGHDCIDMNDDGFCDCPDRNHDGKCDYKDTDGDGLNDCEEVYTGTSHNGADTDADGIDDPMEVRFRTNPAKADTLDDLDWDKVPNGTEVLSGTNPLCDDSAFRSYVAYRYNIQKQGETGDTTCYDFDVSNITLVPTLHNGSKGYPGNGWNRILVYAGEVAFDDPKTYAAYRVACVEASYDANGDFKNPPSGKMNLTNADFVDLRKFDPSVDCKKP